jgi:hypothetical protein
MNTVFNFNHLLTEERNKRFKKNKGFDSGLSKLGIKQSNGKEITQTGKKKSIFFRGNLSKN